jgi:hypothetical protein
MATYVKQELISPASSVTVCFWPLKRSSLRVIKTKKLLFEADDEHNYGFAFVTTGRVIKLS